METPTTASETPLKVLLIEDDARLAQLTATFLQRRGVEVTQSPDGVQGLQEAVQTTYDLVLLDLMLPGQSGLDVCRQIRQRSDVPIIMLTALGDEADRVLGLEAGADDYVAKPFSSPELLARIRAMVRRYRGQAGPGSQRIDLGALVLDLGAMQALINGRVLDLTSYEFAILRVLAERAGRVLNREQLLDLAKGSAEDAFDRSIDGHISRLRKKLGDDPRQPVLLKTVRGVGYLLARSTPQ